MNLPKIVLKKVRVHNLKEVDLTLNQGELVVFTGVSGSGKSSLAFDTIYVEGQRRYIESLSHQARRYLGELPKPDAESISGIAPTIAIEQKTAGKTPRSTVGTMTGIYDFLRVLFARIGVPHCPISKEPVAVQSKEKIIAEIQKIPPGQKLIFLAPFAKGKKGEFTQEFQELQALGFTRARVDGAIVDLSSLPLLDGKTAHDVEIVIDRLQSGDASRIAESATAALEKGKGFFSLFFPDTGEEKTFSQFAYSHKSNLSYGPLEPHDFSFNHPSGMCLSCQGLGILAEELCPSCRGSRIRPYPAETKISGKKIHEITALSLEECLDFFSNLSLSSLEEQIAGEILKEITEKLRFLIYVGLLYLSLDRTSPTLSGGESQRVRLASQIGAGLVGAIYVLDEPSIGLHPSDHHKLIQSILHLRDLGNTVFVVEHDIDTMLAADRIVDVGPFAGQHGGEILGVGTIEEIQKNPKSITGSYLSGRLKILPPEKRRDCSQKQIQIFGASHHNLKNIDVKIPLGGLLCITGVSGSGKSSLIADTLYPALANHFHKAALPVGKCKKIEGFEHIDKIILVDQSPIGRTPRSNPATYIKVFDEIRDLFAKLPASVIKGFDSGHFSFNVKEGSCPYCKGLSQVRIDMDFMEDIWTLCPQCKGARFDPEILSVKFKNHSITDILNMDIEHALVLFESIPSIYKKLQFLSEVGLDYLTLGQPSTTLSGGEAQRIKLAKELVRPHTSKTLYILDEPTTGLHFHDVNRLIGILQKLVSHGNTVLVIEHNLDLIQCADWIIDLGPKAGKEGGEIIGEGTPEKIAALPTPTGIALAGKLPRFVKQKRETKAQDTHIVIKNATQNNLKSVSLQIPRNAITVFTGPSGSGKSSLAFETLYAEGQRRYTETLSPYARTLVKPLPKPKVDFIEGLSPSIALEQKTGGLNPRSTVGTMTEIYDLLRVLYAHAGTAFDPETGEEIRQISKQHVAHKMLSEYFGKKMHVLAPLTYHKKEPFEKFLEKLNQEGFLRLRLNGTEYELDEKIPFEPHKKNELYLVMDRLVADPKNEDRLLEAIQKSIEKSQGVVIFAVDGKDLFFNLSFAVESTGKSFTPITPQTFSFNHDLGMCPECLGLGVTYGAHFASLKPLLKLSIFDIADRLFKDLGTKEAYNLLEDYFSSYHIDCETPLMEFSDEQIALFLRGGEEKTVKVDKKKIAMRWIGLETLFGKAAHMAHGEIKEKLLPFMTASPCSSCHGSRLNPLARNVRIQNTSIHDLCSMTLKEALPFIQNLDLKKEKFLFETQDKIAKQLQFLLNIDLEYLSLSRSAPSLSGGELQRIRLARQLGSGLTSCLYVLDEPTIGLHPFNNEKLNKALHALKDLGNTLILVEHDPLTVGSADYLFDFGPKAGNLGGKIIAHGSIPEIKNNPDSLTGAYLSGRKKIPIPQKRRPFSPDLRIENGTLHNLKNISCAIPYGAITCLTGVSGSGKSTILRHLLKPAAEKALTKAGKKQTKIEHLGACFYGLNHFEKVVTIDQSPIGQTIRADVSTYTEVQPLIRALFAETPEAKIKGLKPGHFSPNHRRGMCRTCWGLGMKTVDLQFLPSVRVTCESCQGNKLNRLSLSIRFKGKHFGQILEMTVLDALHFFENIPKLKSKLQIIESVGLSYLKLGQEIVSLSGGEAQRIRLSKELAKKESGKTLYLIDEPTVGLHSEDIAHLIPIFHNLADKKNTLVIIEHNTDLIQNADYVIDLGPDAGPNGGQIIASGTPEEIARNPNSKTGRYLK